MPLLALGLIGTIPVRPAGWGKADGSLHQRNNYPQKKWVKLAHSPFPTMRLPQLIPLTIHSGLFPEQPPRPKGKSPWPLMCKMTSSNRLLPLPAKKAPPKILLLAGNLLLPPQSGKYPLPKQLAKPQKTVRVDWSSCSRTCFSKKILRFNKLDIETTGTSP